MNGHALHTLVAAFARRTWIFSLSVAIACSTFAAATVSSLVSVSYLAPAASAPPVPVAAAARIATAPPPARPDGRDFVARDMFCSSCAPPAGGPGPTDSFAPQALLIATIISDEPRCIVRALASEAQGSYGVGDPIPGVGTIARIGWLSIDVVDGDRHGHLDLLDTPAAVRGDAGAATPDPAAAAEPWAGRIKKIDDHTYEVDRELVRDMVSGAAKPGGTRILPRTENGKLTGLRMLGVKEQSLAGALGLRNGDVMAAINNTPITSVQTLLDVYANIDSLNVVEIAGERAGKPLDLTLRLR